MGKPGRDIDVLCSSKGGGINSVSVTQIKLFYHYSNCDVVIKANPQFAVILNIDSYYMSECRHSRDCSRIVSFNVFHTIKIIYFFIAVLSPLSQTSVLCKARGY